MPNWVQLLQPLQRSLLDMVLRAPCPLCDRTAQQGFCVSCARQIQRCQLLDPQIYWQNPLPLFAWGQYGGALKRAIATLKYENHPELAEPLGQWTGQSWRTSGLATSRLVVLPIPMYRDKQKQRGFNQAELLARSFCQITRFSLKPEGLVRVRATEAQFGLSVIERQNNLAGAIQISPSAENALKGKQVLLFDDIYTTGATARAAAAVLQQAGIKVFGIVAIAAPSQMVSHPTAVNA
ncbi:ComF family protein [Vacuolonema iberomarrocanum]|uniref:ComF family protein n=1 Tax=Vacuolonema iberomarrocanum TaxID=3454632 RepID=UPI0019F35B30|nr:ComF family protein [filamentous cyanobacterium LEGE 07170]